MRCDGYTDCLGLLDNSTGISSIVGIDEFEGCTDGEFPSYLVRYML